MLRSRLRKRKEDAVSGFLGSQTEFTGKLSFDGVVHIEGHFEGEIISRGTLVVGSDSSVHAQIQSTILKIAGEVHGDLVATERIELYPPARVYGNIQTPVLTVEEGVLFEGSCKMSAVQADIPSLREDETADEPVEAISAHAWSPTYDDGTESEQHSLDEATLPEHDR